MRNWALVGAVVLVTMVSCSSDDKGEASGSTVTELSTTTRPASIEELVVSDVPEGYELQPDDLFDTGPSDLDKAVRDAGGEPEVARQFYEDKGFVTGFQRMWVNAAGDRIIVFVYEFAEPAGATAEVERSLALAAESGMSSAPYPVESAPGAQGLDAADRSLVSILLTSDRYVVQVVGQGTVGGLDAARATAIEVAETQYELLQ